MNRKTNRMSKTIRAALVIAILLIVLCVGKYIYRQSYGFTGEIISWSEGIWPYEVHNLSAGTSMRLSAEQYSKKYDEPGYQMTTSEDMLTIAVYEDEQQVASFSTPQYSFSQPVWMDNILYFIAYETPDRDSGSYLWEYRDGQIRKVLDIPVCMKSLNILMDTQLLFATEEDHQIVLYDIPTRTITTLCEGFDPCYAKQEGCIYFVEPEHFSLARYHLASGETEVLNIRISDFSHMAYSEANQAVLFQVTDGKLCWDYSIYETDTGRHTVITDLFGLLTGWGDLRRLNDAYAICWVG